MVNVSWAAYWHTKRGVPNGRFSGDGRCDYCGYGCVTTGKVMRGTVRPWNSLHKEHLVPRSRLEPGQESMIAQSCQRCNFTKGKKTPEEFKRYIAVQVLMERHEISQDDAATLVDIPPLLFRAPAIEFFNPWWEEAGTNWFPPRLKAQRYLAVG